MQKLTSITGTTVGGRDGHGTTADGQVNIQFALPKELGGAGKPGATPEHLFALGYSACFGSALQYVAGLKKLRLAPDFSVTAVVDLCKNDAGGFAFEIELKVKLPGVDKAEAEALVEQAHTVCPYSNSIKAVVPVKLTVI